MKNQPLAFRGGRNNYPLPNPKAFGFDFGPLQKLLQEIARLYDEGRQLGFDLVQQQHRVRALEAGEIDRLADAMAKGEKPPDVRAEISRARAEAEATEKRIKVLDRARQRVVADMQTLVDKHKDEWRERARSAAEEKAREVEKAVDSLRAAQGELAAVAAIDAWLESGGSRAFSYGGGPSTVETHSGHVNANEVLDALVGSARQTVAAPEERQRMELARLGVVTTDARELTG